MPKFPGEYNPQFHREVEAKRLAHKYQKEAEAAQAKAGWPIPLPDDVDQPTK